MTDQRESRTNRLTTMLERLQADAVVSKFATSRECAIYRQAVEDMLNMVRGEGWVMEGFASSESARWVPMGIAHPDGDADVLTYSTTGHISVTPAAQVRALWRQREPGEDCYYSAWMPLPNAPHVERPSGS